MTDLIACLTCWDIGWLSLSVFGGIRECPDCPKPPGTAPAPKDGGTNEGD